MRAIGCCVLVGALAVVGCHRPATGGATVPSGPKSSPGWEVRYNAALALARRGSDKAKDPAVWDTLQEMLDEQQQLRNFRAQLRDGREVPDESAARVAVISALRAVTELHRKQPGMDLKELNEPIAKLAASDSPLLSNEAKLTQLALAK
jgi:hypothetical protein